MRKLILIAMLVGCEAEPNPEEIVECAGTWGAGNYQCEQACTAPTGEPQSLCGGCADADPNDGVQFPDGKIARLDGQAYCCLPLATASGVDVWRYLRGPHDGNACE